MADPSVTAQVPESSAGSMVLVPAVGLGAAVTVGAASASPTIRSRYTMGPAMAAVPPSSTTPARIETVMMARFCMGVLSVGGASVGWGVSDSKPAAALHEAAVGRLIARCALQGRVAGGGQPV